MAERAALEMPYARKGIEGSNPSLSAVCELGLFPIAQNEEGEARTLRCVNSATGRHYSTRSVHPSLSAVAPVVQLDRTLVSGTKGSRFESCQARPSASLEGTMDQAEQVKSKVDILEVISSYLPLKKTGRNFAALCPFHSEKTPSFMVSPERQVFKCFGCGEAGDVFSFLEKIEGWDFKEALEELAKRAGIKLTASFSSGRLRLREKLISINTKASQFYSHLLTSHPIGAKARDYLARRGIKKSLWEKFALGFAPSGWENSLNFLVKRGFFLDDIVTSGLLVPRDKRHGSFYDRFRNRLVFPLKDSRGSILGFSARTITDTKDEPKYINTPETPIFTKGSILFGLDVTKSAIREKNEAILVEGEFDVLSAYGAGVENVVASKGTALTDKQVATISRLCENVAISFDTDVAGDAAARRGIELLDLAGTNIRVVRLGKYKDPDEFCQKDPKGFIKALGEGLNVYDYFIESAKTRFDPKTVDGKKRIGREIIPILCKISDEIVRAHYIERLADLLDLEVALVASAVEKRVADFYVSDPLQIKNPSYPAISSEKYFLALLIMQDEVENRAISLLSEADFEHESAAKFWKWLGDIIKVSKSKSLSVLFKKLPEDLGEFVDTLYLINVSPIFGEKESWAAELVKIAGRIKRASLKRQLSTISSQLKTAQEKSDRGQIALLTRRFDQISKSLKEAGF